jgi:hypothetical protein
MVRVKPLSVKRFAVAAALFLAAAAPALATNLHLSVQSGGSNTVAVLPGATVNYAVIGQLSDGASDGLAAFSLNLTFSGGALAPAAAPSTAPMTAFDRPAGLTNPAGFGGTVVSGVLVQVGGAQNTIRNTFAPYPNGNVITDVAQVGQALPLVTGQLTAPTTPGNYSLVPSNVVANVILQGQNGIPFWKVEPAQPGALTPLTVIVGPLSRPGK